MWWKDYVVNMPSHFCFCLWCFIYFVVSSSYYGFGWGSKIIWLFHSPKLIGFEFCVQLENLSNCAILFQKSFTIMGEGVWTSRGRWSSMEKVWSKKDLAHRFPKVYLYEFNQAQTHFTFKDVIQSNQISLFEHIFMLIDFQIN